jgi:hypothetical protein
LRAHGESKPQDESPANKLASFSGNSHYSLTNQLPEMRSSQRPIIYQLAGIRPDYPPAKVVIGQPNSRQVNKRTRVVDCLDTATCGDKKDIGPRRRFFG